MGALRSSGVLEGKVWVFLFFIFCFLWKMRASKSKKDGQDSVKVKRKLTGNNAVQNKGSVNRQESRVSDKQDTGQE